MAARGTFQKRQKEAARKEKRQLKLDRRQGRVDPHSIRPSDENPEEDGLNLDTQLDDTGAAAAGAPLPAIMPVPSPSTDH